MFTFPAEVVLTTTERIGLCAYGRYSKWFCKCGNLINGCVILAGKLRLVLGPSTQRR